MKQLLYLTIILTFCLSTKIFPQNPEWINYTNGADNNCVVVDAEHVWVGTNGGLVKIDRVTGEKEFLNRGNSGLPDNHVFLLAFDSNGSLWVGTWQAGLAKYDGSNWDYLEELNLRLTYHNVRAIAINQQGEVWVGGTNWLAKYDGQDWTIYNETDIGSSNLYVTSIALDNYNNVWIGTDSGWGSSNPGLVKFDGNEWTFYNSSNSGLPTNEIRCLAIDHSDNLWIGTWSEGIIKFDGTNWTTGYLSGSVGSITVDQANNKWVSRGWEGLAKFNNRSWAFYDKSNSALPNCMVTCVAIDESNTKWVGTSPGYCKAGEGIAKFENTEFEMISTSNSELPGNWIRSISIDREGNKWIGTQERGLAKFTGTEWTLYNNNSDYPFYRVSCIAFDESGNKWIGTWAEDGWSSSGDGIVKLDGNQWTVFDTDNSVLPSNNVRCIAIDKSDNKWIGTADGYYEGGGGLIKYDDLEWTVYNSTNTGLPSNNVHCLTLDNNDNLWIGTTESGLVKFDGTNWEVYNKNNSGLTSDVLSCIAIDKYGTKWIGILPEWNGSESPGGGLAKYNGTSWEIYDTTNSELPSNWIFCIAIDKSDNKWIGTTNGLAKFDGNVWEVYNVSNSGLSNNRVYCITIDEYNNKWIGTDEGGLTIFNEGGIITDIENVEANRKTKLNEYKLLQNYPNPFNPATKIQYSIPVAALSSVEVQHVTLKVYDILGKEIATLVNQKQKPGFYEVTWDANNIPSGVYFYKLTAGSFTQTKKMILLR